jgi:hypothetical protein
MKKLAAILALGLLCFGRADAFWQSRDSNYDKSVAAGGGGGSPTWLKTANPAVQTVGSGNTATFSGANIGTASSDRIVVVCAATDGGGPLVSPNGVTIGGTNATLAKASNAGTKNAEIWYLNVPSGTSATIAVTGTTGLTYSGITVGILTGVTATPTTTAAEAYGYNGDPNTTSSALTIPATGFGIVCGGSESNGTPTFNVGTLDYKTATGASWSVLSGYISTSGSQTPSISGYSYSGLGIAAASWGP